MRPPQMDNSKITSKDSLDFPFLSLLDSSVPDTVISIFSLNVMHVNGKIYRMGLKYTEF